MTFLSPMVQPCKESNSAGLTAHEGLAKIVSEFRCKVEPARYFRRIKATIDTAKVV